MTGLQPRKWKVLCIPCGGRLFGQTEILNLGGLDLSLLLAEACRGVGRDRGKRVLTISKRLRLSGLHDGLKHHDTRMLGLKLRLDVDGYYAILHKGL